MSELMLTEPVELTDAELDAVSGGQVAVGNLVNVQVKNALNNNNIAVNVAALGSNAFSIQT